MPKPSYADVIKERNELREKLEKAPPDSGELEALKKENEELQKALASVPEDQSEELETLRKRVQDLESQGGPSELLTRAAEAAVKYVDGMLNSCCKSKAGRRVCPGRDRCGTIKEAIRPVRQALGMEAARVWQPIPGSTPRQAVDGDWPTQMDERNPAHMALARQGRSAGGYMPPETLNVPRPNQPVTPRAE